MKQIHQYRAQQNLRAGSVATDMLMPLVTHNQLVHHFHHGNLDKARSIRRGILNLPNQLLHHNLSAHLLRPRGVVHLLQLSWRINQVTPSQGEAVA